MYAYLKMTTANMLRVVPAMNNISITQSAKTPFNPENQQIKKASHF
jgi:hypothetical protein